MGIVRQTKSVKLLLNIFDQKKDAISVVELVKNLSNEMNKTTVYRILDRLEQDGIIHSFMGKEGLKWYAKCKDDCSSDHHLDTHPHFHCNQCGKVQCLSVHVAIPNTPNYSIESSEILLFGTCSDCTS